MATKQHNSDNSLKSNRNMEQGKSSSTTNNLHELTVYRKELRRLQKHTLKLSESNLQDETQEMDDSSSMDGSTEFDKQKLLKINRVISLTRKLKRQMARMKKTQNLHTTAQSHLKELAELIKQNF